MAALSDDPTFKSQVDQADDKMIASLTTVGDRGRFEFTITYTTAEIGGVVTVTRSFRGLTSITSSAVQPLGNQPV